MADSDNAALVRRLFQAYRRRDRASVEGILGETFTFTSPYDDAIDRATYFERCWAASAFIREHVIEHLFVQGEQAFVTYCAHTKDGKQFRNTEFFTFDQGRIASVDVYFGAEYQNGAFLKKGGS
jgi:ketosteroid isomerase-like protein